MKRTRVWILLGAAGALVAGAAAVGTMRHAAHDSHQDAIPSALVRRGDIDIVIHADGELRATQSMMLAAPQVGGDTLQILTLVKTGSTVHKGDVVVEFSKSEQNYKLEQSRSDLQQAEQEIAKAQADSAVLAAQDKVALLKARYDVRKAELDVQTNEIRSRIDADKNQLALDQAKRVLAQLQSDVNEHQASGSAAIYLAKQKYAKARLAMDQAQQNLEKMRVVSPMDGVVSIQRNDDASGGMYFTGMSLPDYRPGDTVRPGTSIAQVLDPRSTELATHVNETERANVRPGLPVTIRFDALPGKVMHGTVKSIGGAAISRFFDESPSHNFECVVQVSDTDPALRPGFTAHIEIEGNRLRHVLYLPRQALFSKDGKWVVFVRNGSSYEQRVVHIVGQSESRAAVEGLSENATVAMMDPTVTRKPSPGAAATGVEGAP
ncbi:MAG: HlyD family efflux transporter periplasmic adaptor subunit [Terracidiphilus sp.]|nr:HlyD family efflux transporter periplasmic adaptor subunit [Terracidiphilus sp.]